MEIDRRAELALIDLDRDGNDDLVFNGRGKIDWWRKASTSPRDLGNMRPSPNLHRWPRAAWGWPCMT